MLQTPSPFAVAEFWREAFVTSATAGCEIAARTTSTSVSLWSSWLDRSQSKPERQDDARDQRSRSWYRTPDSVRRSPGRDGDRATAGTDAPSPWSPPTPPWSLLAFMPRPDEMRAEGPWMAAAMPWLELGREGAGIASARRSDDGSPYSAYRTAGGHASAQIIHAPIASGDDARASSRPTTERREPVVALFPFAWMLPPWLPR